MISVKSKILDACYRAQTDDYPEIVITDEEIHTTASFPTLLIREYSETYRNTLDSSQREKHVRIHIEAQVFSNKLNGGRREVETIMAIVDQVLWSSGFLRVENRPLTNLEDTRISRQVARWRAIVDENLVTYRR